MKALCKFYVITILFFSILGCGSSNNSTKDEYEFTVTLKNIGVTKKVLQGGGFSTAKNTTGGPLLPGEAMSFSFKADKNARLSFATMLVESNDYFIAPSSTGIALYEGETPIIGDITSQIKLWDAGTEVNQEPGIGVDQPLRQSVANTGAVDSNNLVRIADDSNFNVIPDLSSLVNVQISNDNEGYFTITIKNISDTSTFSTPFAGLVYLVHSTDGALFKEGEIASIGLEAIAEDGDSSILAAALDSNVSGTVNLAESTKPGIAGTGQSYSFQFRAGKNQRLSFATMLVQSNDYFFATPDTGISLYTDDVPLSGDITSQIKLYDAGTEINQTPGSGADQPPRQSAENTGSIDPDPNVREVTDDFSIIPQVTSLIKVTISNYDNNGFTVIIQNTSSVFNTPLSPGYFVIHSTGQPIFELGSPAKLNGLEELAEDGNNSVMESYFNENKGDDNILTPGVWSIFTSTNPIFRLGNIELGNGLEELAEDGDPSKLLSSATLLGTSGVFNTPINASLAGPLSTGNSYQFTFKAKKRDYLTFASMYVNSNDIFYSFSESGLKLFDSSGKPLKGDVTSSVLLYDAGTEKNQFPGAGLNQPLFQSAPNQGEEEVKGVSILSDGFTYPSINQLIEISIEAN